MAKASFTTFLLLATLALLATVAAQTPSPTTSSVVTTTTTKPTGTATTAAPTGSATAPPAYTNSVNFSSLANVISNFASAKPPAATGAAGAAGSAGNTVGPHMGAAAVVLAAVVAMF
ncbi:hypothetical protein BGZ52_003162 [Haplosporangium bisporale]|uniref:Uncharacterized protein n=1 Tax=Podila verticillata NRRL 6337 TaxID=1069443 RepID=A0A086TMD9_9FUNG|nr:hypothetical protein BGZ52_003162 [Haplosporangium bisporale]KAF9213309.1 hypothetical protein BGZ59_005551 [Podila verticillata]KFH63116.1 hypothetical protein MVEG_11153 [Podila verticillata NRRL 6337]